LLVRFVNTLANKMLPIFERHPLFPRRSRFSFAVRIFPLFKAFPPAFFLSHPPTPFSVWYSHLASGPVRPSSYPSAQVLWRLDFPILQRVSFQVASFWSPFGKSRDPKFWILFGLPPEPSAHRAIHIHPNSVLIISFTSHLLPSLIKQKGKGRYILSCLQAI